MTLLIGYDLNSPGQNYDNLIKTIKGIGAWWHYLDSTWLVTTSKSPTAVRDLLKPHIDSDDELLVLDVSNDNWASYGLQQSGNDWLRNNL